MKQLMNRHKHFALIIPLILIGTVLVCVFSNAFAEEEESQTGPTFDTFKIVLERNIFDPKRVPPRERQRPVAPPAPRTETFTLLGAMLNEDDSYAFFSGTSPSHSAVFEIGGTIEGYKIARIDTDCVVLEKGGKEIKLAVSTGMSRTGDGEWEIDTRRRSYTSIRLGSDNSSPAGRDSGNSESADDSTSDILKKLMERRKQELNK